MTRRQTASIVFVVLCIVLVAAAVTLNIGWIRRRTNIKSSLFAGKRLDWKRSSCTSATGSISSRKWSAICCDSW